MNPTYLLFFRNKDTGYISVFILADLFYIFKKKPNMHCSPTNRIKFPIIIFADEFAYFFSSSVKYNKENGQHYPVLSIISLHCLYGMHKFFFCVYKMIWLILTIRGRPTDSCKLNFDSTLKTILFLKILSNPPPYTFAYPRVPGLQYHTGTRA